LMAFQPGSSVWAPQSFFNSLLTLSISRLPHQPFHSRQQWKQASIIFISKSLPPKQHADFRLISITPVLTRIMVKAIVHEFLYLTFLSPLQLYLSLTNLHSVLPALHVRQVYPCSTPLQTCSSPIHQLQSFS